MRILLLALLAAPVLTQPAPATDFVGTTPCADPFRAFVGGLAPGARCHSIAWRLTLRDAGGSNRWNLTAVYGVPSASNPNVTVDGPRATVEGAIEQTRESTLDRNATVYRLTAEQPARSLSLAAISGEVLHLLGADGTLLKGTSGYSYTLYDADRVEPPPGDMPGREGSYSIPPKATGPAVFGIFGGRSPCVTLARALKLAEPCGRVKWRVTLFQDAASEQPTTYRIDSSLHRDAPRGGAWRIVRGTRSNANAILYRLEGTATEGPIWLLRGDAGVLFFSDDQGVPFVGTKDFSYTLNRDS